MKSRAILLTAIIILSTSNFTHAQKDELSGTLSFTYMSKTIVGGFDYYADDHSAYMTVLGLDLYGTGLGLNTFWSRAISAPFENAETLGLDLYYGNTLWKDENYNTNYRLGWIYIGYPDEPRSGTTRGQAADMQELYVSLSWPKSCPFGTIPSYTIVSMWPSEGQSTVRNNGGMLHIFGLSYDFNITGLHAVSLAGLPDTPEQKLHLSAEAVYNDGAAPGTVPGPGTTTSKIDHDWSHALFGISTNFDIAENLSFTPGFYYQSSWEDSVNTEDEYWLTLSLAYKF
jgi:hypothetical protein